MAQAGVGRRLRRAHPGRRLLLRRPPALRRTRAVLAGDEAPWSASPATGNPILGICNGFQILVEMGLLPGALLANDGLKFRCQDTRMQVERTDSPFTNACAEGQILRLNMAHYEGNYFADEVTLVGHRDERVRWSCDSAARTANAAAEHNPNGSINDIAALRNPAGNVLGSDAAPGTHADLGAWLGRRAVDVRVAAQRSAGWLALPPKSRLARSLVEAEAVEISADV